MAKLYTRKGDDGCTVLSDGSRVGKDDKQVDAYGIVDELNAHLGLAAALVRQRGGDLPPNVLRERLIHIQNELLAIGAELAMPVESQSREKAPSVTAEQVLLIESWIDEAVSPGDHSYYLRAVQGEGPEGMDVVWSSPIFVAVRR